MVTVSYRWFASMVDKQAGMDWLRESGNGALIIETVAAPTLTAFAKDKAVNGQPLPGNLFTVGSTPYTSIEKS